jgi:hypothetical protein
MFFIEASSYIHENTTMAEKSSIKENKDDAFKVLAKSRKCP